MSESKESPTLKVGVANGLLTLMVSITAFGCGAAVIGAAALGNGRNQSISESRIIASCYLGMPLADFCDKMGIRTVDRLQNAKLVLAEPGWLSIFIPQRRIEAEFDPANRLTGVFVETTCGADESGWRLPLRPKVKETLMK